MHQSIHGTRGSSLSSVAADLQLEAVLRVGRFRYRLKWSQHHDVRSRVFRAENAPLLPLL